MFCRVLLIALCERIAVYDACQFNSVFKINSKYWALFDVILLDLDYFYIVSPLNYPFDFYIIIKM